MNFGSDVNFGEPFSEIDKVFRRILSTWRSLDFTCCLVEVMSVTVTLVLEFVIIWAEFGAIFAREKDRRFIVRVTKSSIRLVTCTLLT